MTLSPITVDIQPPAIILVVHIDPGPIPTFIASAIRSTKNLAASPVAIFPTITSKVSKGF